jgi:hypothetical protein
MSWYEDITEMERDDAYLQTVYDRLWSDLPEEARRRTENVHVYPSLRCTYTIGKQRIFIRVRDPHNAGSLLPECALRHVLLHELAHVINPTLGHDGGFRRWFHWLLSFVVPKTCGDAVPIDFNPC